MQACLHAEACLRRSGFAQAGATARKRGNPVRLHHFALTPAKRGPVQGFVRNDNVGTSPIYGVLYNDGARNGKDRAAHSLHKGQNDWIQNPPSPVLQSSSL
jgi:hypothetical protein